ncbi:MAG: hypothetical protein AAF409_04655 [Pseudomonadota bacterium]
MTLVTMQTTLAASLLVAVLSSVAVVAFAQAPVAPSPIEVSDTVDQGALVRVSVSRAPDGRLDLQGPASNTGAGETATVAQVLNGTAQFTAPRVAGTYRLNHVSKDGRRLASTVIDVAATPVSLSTDSPYNFGVEVIAHWRGPAAAGDRLVVVEVQSGAELSSVEALGMPGDLTATSLPPPTGHGSVELQYVMADGTVLRRLAFTINPPRN